MSHLHVVVGLPRNREVGTMGVIGNLLLVKVIRFAQVDEKYSCTGRQPWAI